MHTKKLTIFLVMGLVIALAITMEAHAVIVPNVVYVDDDFNSSTSGWGYDHFASIQDAIDNANNGDTIKVYPGIYRENVVIYKEIKLVGDPIIDAHGGIGISIEANNTLIENMTIFNASIGINVHNNSFEIQNVTIRNLTLYNCTYTPASPPASGIKFDDVNGSTIYNCNMNNNFVGIYLKSSYNTTIYNCDIKSTIINSYGIWLDSSSNNTISNCSISIKGRGIQDSYSFNNSFSNCNISGGLYGMNLFHSQHDSISNSSISDVSQHGIFVSSSSNNTIFNCNISNNYHGIDLYKFSSRTTIYGCNIINNTHYGIHIYGSHYNTISHCNIYGNGDGMYSNLPANAEFNYWGSNNGPGGVGPGSGDNVTNNIDYSPWLGYSWPTKPMTYHTNDDIQDAINDSSDGDTIVVHDGVYKENVAVNKSVVIINGSKPIIDAMAGVAFNVTVNNVSIIGFNITNASYGIYCENVSGFYIANNTFWYDNYSIYWDIEKYDVGMNYTVYEAMIKDNEFYTNKSYDVIYTYIDLDFANESYNATIENISMLNNIFYMNGTSTYGIYIDGIYVENITNGSISVGVLNISENKIYGGRDGVYFYGDFYYLTNVSINVGDFIINDNIMLNQSLYGMYIDYYDAGYWYGNTIGTFGDLKINKNKIDPPSSTDGIYVSDYAYWENFYDNASLMTGNIYIQNNKIDVDGEAIYLYYSYGAYYFYDNTSVVMGNAYIDGNKIYNSSDGIYVEIDDFNELYGNVSAEMGFIHIADNRVNSSEDGIYFYAYNLGYDMYGNTTLVMGDFIIYNNTVTTDDDSDGIYVYAEGWGEYMYNNSSCNIGNFKITKNNISCDDGIYFEYFEYVGYEMYGNASVIIGDFAIDGNKINATNKGIHIDDSGFYYWGYEMYDNSSIIAGNFSFSKNEINAGSYGIYFYTEEWASSMYDNSSFQLGDFRFNQNEIDAGSGSMYVWPYYIGYEMEDNATAIIGSWYIVGNNITSGSYGIETGPYDVGEDMDDNTSFKMGDFVISHNNISSSSNGIEYYPYDVGHGMDGNNLVVMGNTIMEENTINASGYGIYLYYGIADDMYYNSSLFMGKTRIANNSINSSDDGIYVYYDWAGYVMYDNATFEMGFVNISNNEINSSDDGIYFYYHEIATSLSDNASVILDGVGIENNSIKAGDYGIYFYYWWHVGYNMEDNSSATFGKMYIKGNDINSSDDAIYFDYEGYVAYEMEGNSSIFMNNVYIENNILNSSADAIYMYFAEEEVGWHMYDNASAKLPDYIIRNNTINADGDGIYVDPEEIPYEIYQNSLFYFSGFLIDNNTICGYNGIDIEYDNLCDDNNDDSLITIGNVTVSNNEIHATNFGTYIYYDRLGYEIYDHSNLTVGDVNIYNNTMDCIKGIYVSYYYVDAYDYTTISMGFLNIVGNEISNCSEDGINIFYAPQAYDHSTISIERAYIANNTIFNCSYGIYVDSTNIQNDSNAIVTLFPPIIYNNTIVAYASQGISMHAVNNSKIENNTLIHYHLMDGMRMDGFDGIYYEGAILLFDCNGSYVANNTINSSYEMRWYGIAIINELNDGFGDGPCYNKILNNTINATFYSVYLYNTDNETVAGNEINDPWHGIFLENTRDSNVSFNTLWNVYGDGILLYSSLNNTIMNNTMEAWNKPLIGETYTVYIKNGNEWEEIGQYHLFKPYQLLTIPLARYNLGNGCTIRISQHGGVAAHVDYVALKDGDYFAPSSAFYVDDGGSVLGKISSFDYDVLDILNKTVEISWDGSFENPVLLIRANEEPYGRGIPITTPRNMIPDRMKEYVITNNGAMNVDGTPDELGSPDFSAYWIPGTGHPPGYTYLWLRSDGEYLYAAMEVTGDNTYDDTGWGSIYIYNGNELKEFRVDSYNHEYGMDGFVYTSAVEWQHMFYEFAIPLNEIEAKEGDAIKIGFGSYGTLGAPEPEHVGIIVNNSWLWRGIVGNYIISNNISNFTYGIGFYGAQNDKSANNSLYSNYCGIYLVSSYHISFEGDAVSSSQWFAFYSDEYSDDNIANNLTIESYPTRVSFFYSNGIAFKGVEKNELHPNDGFVPINKFLNITGVTPNSWINITFWYSNDDVANVNESSLALYEWNGSKWNEVPSHLNESKNEINTLITSFSIYGIFGELNYSYMLHKGWNLITVPINVTWHAYDLAAFINEQYGSNICTTIVMLDAIHQHHIGWVAAMPDLNNFTIKPGMGYWVYVGDNVTITWHGKLASVDIKLHDGYNLVGWTSLQKGNASMTLHKIRNESMAITWNESMAKYKTYIKTTWGYYYGDNFELLMGKGFYVYCMASDKWYGS